MHTIDVQGSGAIASLSCSVVGYVVPNLRLARGKGAASRESRARPSRKKCLLRSARAGASAVSLWCSAPGVATPTYVPFVSHAQRLLLERVFRWRTKSSTPSAEIST
jgi:hypothetical protein